MISLAVDEFDNDEDSAIVLKEYVKANRSQKIAMKSKKSKKKIEYKYTHISDVIKEIFELTENYTDDVFNRLQWMTNYEPGGYTYHAITIYDPLDDTGGTSYHFDISNEEMPNEWYNSREESKVVFIKGCVKALRDKQITLIKKQQPKTPKKSNKPENDNRFIDIED